MKAGVPGFSARRAPGQQVHSTTADTENGYSFIFVLGADFKDPVTAPALQLQVDGELEGPPLQQVSMPASIFATRSSSDKIDLWCVDGAATTSATFDRNLCFNIRTCSVQIRGSNSEVEDGKMMCTEMGDANVVAYDPATGQSTVTLLTNVLIHPAFPFHIFSEIVAFDKGVQCMKKKDSWNFTYNDTFVVHASQRLLNDPSHKGRSDSKLYWIDQEPPVYLNRASTYPAPTSNPMPSTQGLATEHAACTAAACISAASSAACISAACTAAYISAAGITAACTATACISAACTATCISAACIAAACISAASMVACISAACTAASISAACITAACTAAACVSAASSAACISAACTAACISAACITVSMATSSPYHGNQGPSHPERLCLHIRFLNDRINGCCNPMTPTQGPAASQQQ